jgi:DNA-binding LacI/PurR family transcriptional regulator
LSLGRTSTIGVIVPFFTRPSPVERLRGISEVFEGSAYDLVDDVTVMSMSPSEDDVRSLKHSSLPVVLLDAEHPSSSRCSKTARVAAISPPAT